LDDSLLVSRDDTIAVITLNRPDKLNAFAGGMAHALRDALATAGSDPAIRAVLLTGAGRGFCAGQDLADVAPGQDLGQTLETRFNPVIRAIRALPKPVVCAVQGVAAGAGANLAFACDIVLAGQSARFIQAFIRIGLIPDAGGTWLLPRLAGDARARGMAMLGEPISAAQAESWGLIWRTVADDALAAEALATARQLAALPTHAIALMKRALDSAATATLDQQLDTERDLQREAGFTPDFQEGVRAFTEKRPACFTGKAPHAP
jgi:2-(1,2-epoxy-1,2-dihydrophenyl)acetyl-CoA isomerase